MRTSQNQQFKNSSKTSISKNRHYVIKEILLAGIWSASKIYRRLEHKSDLYKMDIRSYFGSTSQGSSDAKADSDSATEDHGTDSSDPESSPCPLPLKKVCKSSKNKRYHRSVSTKSKYSKSWEKDFSWLYYDEDSEGAICKIRKQSGISGLQRTGGVWVTKPFKN